MYLCIEHANQSSSKGAWRMAIDTWVHDLLQFKEYYRKEFKVASPERQLYFDQWPYSTDM